jgi:hypothetical protein
MAAFSSDMVSARTLLLLIGPLVLLWAFLFGRVRQYLRLKQFKGPATSGISWWWHSKAVLSGRAHEYYGDVIEKYGMEVWSLARCVID